MINSEFPTPSSKRSPQSSSSGNLLGALTAGFYVLFTLLPDSSSFMVTWPGVLIWQMGLLCPVLWLLGLLWQRRSRWLDNQIDGIVGVLILGLIISAGLAEFPVQARWHSWAVFCFLAALYALNTWLSTPQRRLWILMGQGYLSLAFIGVSLLLWGSQTLLPELARLRDLQQYGVNLAFDFSNIELRNWAPIGHQNYVAGYLVLVLPLLIGLGMLQSNWQRWIWWIGAGLGFLDLYTTSSRTGWLGAVVCAIAAMAILLWQGRVPRLWLGVMAAAGVFFLGLLLLLNNRLWSLTTGLLSGQGGGELAYRVITVATGWRMGISHFFSGIGPGAVPLLYQKYRPIWAGREAELAYQLHSTPAQLWAELGLWAVVTVGGAIALITYLSVRWFQGNESERQMPGILMVCLLLGLMAYSLVSLSDYQLDNVCISGLLVIFLAVLIAEFRTRQRSVETLQSSIFNIFPLTFRRSEPFLPLAGCGIVVAAVIWLVPIHRAWMLSSQGFAALSRGDDSTFVQKLTNAYQSASWEPYYSSQLAWTLGNQSLQTHDPKDQQALIQSSLMWFKLAIADSPYQEFGHTNLAWLLVDRNPQAAARSFTVSAQLTPAKRGVFYGLGLSLLAQGKPELATDALALEMLRDPMLVTSPIWRLPQLQGLYPTVLQKVVTQLTVLVDKLPKDQSLASQLRQIRGVLQWWQGDLAAAHADLDLAPTPVSRLVLALSQGPVDAATRSELFHLVTTNPSPELLAIAAWLEASQRSELLQKAWITANRLACPPELLQQLVESMGRSPTFDQWLKQMAPSRQYRRERAGFGVLSRHIGGANPVDYLTVVENIPMTQFFNQFLPSPGYLPDLDQLLQPQREDLLKRVLNP